MEVCMLKAGVVLLFTLKLKTISYLKKLFYLFLLMIIEETIKKTKKVQLK